MPDFLEAALTRTLSSAADAAPAPQPGLPDAVEARFSRRRRRRNATVAGVAAFGVIVTSAVAAVVVSGPQRPEPTTGRVAVAAPGADPPLASVWPEAYHKISARLEDDRKLYPQLLVNDHELLVTTEASFENTDQLWIVNLNTRDARRVARLPGPREGTETYASHFTVGSGHVVWWDSYAEDGKMYSRIWKAKLSGGVPALVATVPGSYGTGGVTGDQLVVHDDTVYFSDQVDGGVTGVPLNGGGPRRVPGSDGYHIVYWPWIGQPGVEEALRLECDDRGAQQERSCASTAEPSEVRIFTELRNLETGAELTVKQLDAELGNVVCGVIYCLGDVPGDAAPGDAASGRETSVFTRDGKREQRIPSRGGVKDTPALDRFVLVTESDPMAQSLYDLKTGRHGDFGIRLRSDGSVQGAGYQNGHSRLIWWPVDGRSYGLIDLGAIR